MNVIDTEAAVLAILRQSTAVAAVFYGQLITTYPGLGWRIYPDVVEAATLYPAAVFQEISEVPALNTEGPGLSMARIQIDCYATTRSGAFAALAVIDACLCARNMPGQVGFQRLVSVDGVAINIQGIMADVRRGGYEQSTKLFRRGRDYHVAASPA